MPPGGKEGPPPAPPPEPGVPLEPQNPPLAENSLRAVRQIADIQRRRLRRFFRPGR